MTKETTRRWWSVEEDQILRQEFGRQDRSGQSTNWRLIALKLPQRSNKDCRKRWSKIGGDRNTGAWSEAEDDILRRSVSKHGSRWTFVAQDVGTRNADQCSKRWLHFLAPELDRSDWKPEDDQRLIAAVIQHGHSWKTIVEECFPKRSLTNVKNRYSNLENGHFSARKQSVRGNAASSTSSASSPSPGRIDNNEIFGIEQTGIGLAPGLAPDNNFKGQTLQMDPTYTGQHFQTDQQEIMAANMPVENMQVEGHPEPPFDSLMLDYSDVNLDWTTDIYGHSICESAMSQFEMDQMLDPRILHEGLASPLTSDRGSGAIGKEGDQTYATSASTSKTGSFDLRRSSLASTSAATRQTPSSSSVSHHDSPSSLPFAESVRRDSRHRLLLENITADSVEKILSILIKSSDSEFKMKLSSLADMED